MYLFANLLFSPYTEKLMSLTRLASLSFLESLARGNHAFQFCYTTCIRYRFSTNHRSSGGA